MGPSTAVTAGLTHVTRLFNFFDKLRRVAPTGRRLDFRLQISDWIAD
jgi:hypothetical protein